MDLEQQQEQQNKPKILPLLNGPYYLLNDTIPKVVPNLKTLKPQMENLFRI